MNKRHTDSTLRFSILTPVYNDPGFLGELITSVLQQDYPHYEHIIIDDGSSDNCATVNTLRRYPHLKWKSQSNIGQYPTQNRLMKMASGDVLSIICADDLYPTGTVLSSVARHFAAKPDLDVVVGRTRRLTEGGGRWYVFDPDLPAFLAKRLVRYCLNIQHCAFFVRRRLLQQEDLHFDISYTMRGDWDWILRVLAATTRVEYTNEVFAHWRLHRRQTSQVGGAGESEARRLCSAHGISYRAHRTVASVVNRLGMMCAAYSMARQLGPAAALGAVLSRARRNFGRVIGPESS